MWFLFLLKKNQRNFLANQIYPHWIIFAPFWNAINHLLEGVISRLYSVPLMAHLNLHTWSIDQSRLTFCDSMDCGLQVSSVHGIFQARILEWVAISYPRESSQPKDWTLISCVSCIGREILYHCTTWEALTSILTEIKYHVVLTGLPWWCSGKESACSAGDQALIPEWGRSSGEGNGNLLQYSCLENLKDRRVWQATVHRAAQSQAQPNQRSSGSSMVLAVAAL